jgi:hypothetical protein
MEVREEDVRDVHGAPPALEQSVMRVGTVIHDDSITTDFDEISGPDALERWCWGPGAEERDFRRPGGLRLRRFEWFLEECRCGGGRRHTSKERATFHGWPPVSRLAANLPLTVELG